MRSKYQLILRFLVIIVIIQPVLPRYTIISSDETTNNELRISALTEISSVIAINDLPGSLTNWSWAVAQGYCTGAGTLIDPYVITDLFFNTSSITDNCLTILNSRKHFVIQNCLFRGYWNYAGVKLSNTTNGIIRSNNLYPLTGVLVWISNSSSNEINNNNASAAYAIGFILDGIDGISRENIVRDNLISFNLFAGIQIRFNATRNQILRNSIFNNRDGIQVIYDANNNTIKLNMIRGNTQNGIAVSSKYNNIYKNCFLNNSNHALDVGVGNNWDYGLIGNYWDNYTGSDNNGDGIGDVSYNITGTAGSKDNYPLIICPFPTAAGGIPGYDLMILMITSTGMIIGIIYVNLRKKLKFHKKKLPS